MRVLYLGATQVGATSRHRADALRRLGCEVHHLDPFAGVPAAARGLSAKLHYRTGYVATPGTLVRWLHRTLQGLPRFDLCWVDSGELVGPSVVSALRQHARHVVLFNHDDPTGPRDRMRFWSLRRALPHYDLCLAVRDVNVQEWRALGARDVLRVSFSYDEVAHRAREPEAPVAERFRSDIAFIGRQMAGEGRDLHMLHLVEQGHRVAIWGDNWQQSRVWSRLAPHWRGQGLAGQDYVDAIRGAAVCVGMLSKGNRDEYTTRTMEIPAAGGLLCAERTPTHQALYREGEEAVFWSSAEECAQQCQALLADPERRERIRLAGMARLRAHPVGNEDVVRAALRRLHLLES